MSEPHAEASLPQVAIVGRPNVGKSTLFNRIVGRRQAIVGSESGMTRDRHSAEADWAGIEFLITDTGGLEYDSPENLLRQVEQHVMAAVEVADAALFVVDGREGPLPVEREIAQRIRRTGIPLALVVNKCDTPERCEQAPVEFAEMGVEPILAVSAEHGLGVAELLDAVLEMLPEVDVARWKGLDAFADEESDDLETAPDDAAGEVRVAVVGRPNVGKSSLVNALLGTARVIVSDEPGTTRDAIDTVLERHDRRYVLVDTAGIRRRARVDTHAEMASVAVAKRRMAQADVALLVIDQQDGLTRQDLHVASEADSRGCGLVVVVNKWDTVDEQDEGAERILEAVRWRLGRMRYAPVVTTSATEEVGIDALLPLIDEVAEARARRVPTADLNSVFEAMVGRHAPAGGITATQPKFLTQVAINPPRFVAFTGGRGAARADYRRYLENRLRAAFDFAGTPLVVKLRKPRRRGSGRGR